MQTTYFQLKKGKEKAKKNEKIKTENFLFEILVSVCGLCWHW